MEDHNSPWLYGDNPCKGCTPETGRSAIPNCHTTCERHLEWVKKKDERKAIIDNENAKESLQRDFVKHRYTRYQRRNGIKGRS